MVNAQEWLDGEYPKEGFIDKYGRKVKRSEVREIYLNEPSLEGELDLGDFTYKLLWIGVKVYIFEQVDKTKLTFINKPKHARIYLENRDAKIGLDYNYPSKEWREQITRLDIYHRNLRGDLDLIDFINLKELGYGDNKLTFLNVNNCFQLEIINCFSNKLTNLDISNCFQLEIINCSHNLLTNITLPANPSNLKHLDLRNNNFLTINTQNLSFLVRATNLEILRLGNDDEEKIRQGIYNRFTGSLNYLRRMKKLKELDINNTDINEVNIDKLPRSLEKIEYSTKYRLDCKLTEIVLSLEPIRHGWCKQCQKSNTSYKWCQPCAEKEWQQLKGQELVEKFIEQQQIRGTDKKKQLQWIPYEQFTQIEYLTEGGFSKIYKVIWKKNYVYMPGGFGETYVGDWRNEKESMKDVVLKVLANSQNITLEFLQEIVNTKLVDYENDIVKCYGISQDPQTKNYVMVMDYKEEGNLREYLRNNYSELYLLNKLVKLSIIVNGLSSIHKQNLIHHDFHSGNILNYYDFSYITDFGLSRSVNSQFKEGKIFGVLPYIAPEVLQGKSYTQKSDIYSFGIIACELLANSYPYPEMDNLALAVCSGLRPNLDELKIPQLLKDLIKRCWDAKPDQRPSAEELRKIIYNWYDYGEFKKDTEFYQQYQVLADEYNTFSQTTPYQIHPNAILTSKMIDTKEINKKLIEFSQPVEFDTDKIDNYIKECEKQEIQSQLQTHQETPPK